MQLFIPFGVQSSVPPKTVVAVISADGGQSNSNFYNFAARENYYVENTASPVSQGFINNLGLGATTLIVIPQGVTTITTNGEWSYAVEVNSSDNSIQFHATNNNGTVYGVGGGATTINLNPNTYGIYFVYDTRPNVWLPQKFLSNLQALTVSYNLPSGDLSQGSSYSFTFTDNVYVNWTNGGGDSHPDYMTGNYVDLIGGAEYLQFTNNNWHWIHFYNGSTYLGYYENLDNAFYGTNSNYVNYLGAIGDNNIIPVPAGTTRIRTTIRYVTHAFATAVSTSNFQANTLYNLSFTGAGQTVTFFDEYPNGTQIGDVVEVSSTVPASDVTVEYFDNTAIDPVTLNTTSNNSRFIVKITNISQDTIILSNPNGIGLITYTGLGDWLNSADTYLSGYASGSNTITNVLGKTVYLIYPKSGATWFTDTTFVQGQQLTVSYSGGTATVDPPATYKIRQLVFE